MKAIFHFMVRDTGAKLYNKATYGLDVHEKIAPSCERQPQSWLYEADDLPRHCTTCMRGVAVPHPSCACRELYVL